jgi:hypothetical protein
MHLILNFSILYPYLINFHYFLDNNVYRLKKGLVDETKAQKQVTIHTNISNIVDEFMSKTIHAHANTFNLEDVDLTIMSIGFFF